MAPSQDAPRQILIVDDEEGMRETLCDILEVYGYEVTEAANGQEAVDHVRREPFDLILMDMTMPVMDGATALGLIREIRLDARVIVMTAYAHGEALSRARETGVEAVIYKPLDPAQLVQLIEVSLEREAYS